MIREHFRSVVTILTSLCMAFGTMGDAWAAKTPNPADSYPTTTPIKHLVVIFNENVSFDHYFGTYPEALNIEGEPAFNGAKGTQTDINNLRSNQALLSNNPNLNPANNLAAGALNPLGLPAALGSTASNPFRLDRTQANT